MEIEQPRMRLAQDPTFGNESLHQRIEILATENEDPDARLRLLERDVEALRTRNRQLEQSHGEAMARCEDAERSLREALARSQAAKKLLTDHARRLDAVLTSTTWRVMMPVRLLGQRVPVLARLGRRLLTPKWPRLTRAGRNEGPARPRSRFADWVAVIARIRADYRQVHGRAPALFRPRLFSEKIQWRKLFELDPVFAVISDKVAARTFVAKRIGTGRQAELLWVGDDPDAIPFDQLSPPYVLKSTHASGHALIVRDNDMLNVSSARALARGWLAYCHGSVVNEPAYINLPRRLIVERLLTNPDGTPPLEHRVFTYDGRAAFIRTTVPDAEGKPRFGDVHSREWERLPISWESPPSPVPPPRPALLEEIIELSERLSAGMTHCRVDLYDRGTTLMVGELTLYSQSGLIRYGDPADDFALGRPWTIPWAVPRALWAIAFRRWEIR